MQDVVETDREDLEAESFKNGFTGKAFLGAIFLAFIMLPGAIYLGLMVGQGLGGAAQWVTIVLFTEVARRSFIKLRRQELYIIFYLASSIVAFQAGIALVGMPVAHKIWAQYIVQSPQAAGMPVVPEYARQYFAGAHVGAGALRVLGLPLSSVQGIHMLAQAPQSAGFFQTTLSKSLPAWFAPPPGSEAYVKRTLFHHDWLLPLGIMILTAIFGAVVNICLGYTLFRVTSDIERLPFPLAPVAAAGATALAEVSQEKESWRWRIFSIGSMIGALFGFIYIGVPLITGAIFTRPLMIIPIPWIDTTLKTQQWFPGGATGIVMDLGLLFVGFIIPFPIICGQFVSALTSQLVVNPWLVRNNIITTWKPGYETIPCEMAANFDFWLSFRIGTALAIAVLGIGALVVILLKTGKKGKQAAMITPPKGRGDFPLWLAGLLYLIAISGFIMIAHRLVPKFPIGYLLFFGIIWTPLNSYISARMQGMTGQPIHFPYIREGSFMLSGYKGVDIWMAPIPLLNCGGMAQLFRQLELTRTKITSLIKAQLLMFPLMIIAGLLFWSYIWRLNPIPSAQYPYVQKMWPFHATFTCLWFTCNQNPDSFLRQAIKLPRILQGFGLGMGLYGLLAIFKVPVAWFYGFMAGMGARPHHGYLMLAGGILNKVYLQKKFGKKKWRAYAPVLLAGYGCGVGLVGMAALALLMIAKAASYLPY